MLQKVEITGAPARLEFVDQMDRNFETFQGCSQDSRVRAPAQSNCPHLVLFEQSVEAPGQALDWLDSGNNHAGRLIQYGITRLTSSGIDPDDAARHGCWVRTITIGMPPTCG